MKLKLPCCEINKKPRNAHWEWQCAYCECSFKTVNSFDDHNREIHREQFAVKRKLECCHDNEKKRQKTDHHECIYCECTFRRKLDRDSHVIRIHECQNCGGYLMLADDVRAQHTIRHNQEARLEKLQKLRQRQMDDDFVLNYVKANKLDEYQPQPDYEPDFDYIIFNYRFEKDVLLPFVKAFKCEFLDTIMENYDDFGSAEIVHLAENGALSIEDVADFLDCVIYGMDSDDEWSVLFSYLVANDYDIQTRWVARVIDNDEIIECIKEKNTFTFDEIYEERDNISIYNDEAMNRFYVAVHKHFPDPDFKDPFADPYDDFKCVQTNHVRDHLYSRYFYDSDADKLSIVVGNPDNEREISLGRCAEMLEKNLDYLIPRYEEEIKVYDELNAKVSALFDEREQELDRATKKNDRDNIFDVYHDEIYGEALPERNDQANIVSKLYFVISMK